MSRKTSVEWLTLIATFSLLCVAVYAFLYELTVQMTLLSGVLLVLVIVLWAIEYTSVLAVVKSN